MSPVDIERCQVRMPKIKNHFMAIDPKPKEEDVFFGGQYDIVVATQSLFYEYRLRSDI